MNINKNIVRKSYQAGFTLVELLVGVALSLVIISVAITYLVSSSAAFKVNLNDGYIQENSRFALSFITNTVRRSGSNSEIDLGFTSPLLNTEDRCLATSGDSTSSNQECSISNSGPNSSDKIAISYILRDGNSCNGQDISTFYTPDNNELIVDEFWVATDDEGLNNLFCRTSLRNSDGTLTQQGGAFPIIPGIDMMKFNYAVDSDDDFIVDQYLTIEEVKAGNFEANIRAVKVGLLVSSGISVASDAITETEENRTYTIFGVDSAEINDSILRQIFSTTIHLPNARER